MSESVSSPLRRKRFTTGHSREWTAGLSSVVLGIIGFAVAWHFATLSGTGFFLRLCALVLVLTGLAFLGLRVQIVNHRDYYGGLALILFAFIAFWAGADLAGMRGFSFGAGTAPRLFAGLLLVVGGLVALIGLLTAAEPIGGYAVRGPVLVTAAIISFALLIRPLGLIIAAFLTFMISAMGSKETRLLESLIVAAALTGFCVLVFVYLLGLPFQLWPRF